MSGPWDAERLAAVVIGTLEDEAARSDAMARRAARSRTQFFRVFKAMIDETPAAMRRRLLLERAAWQLGRTRLAVTDVAFDAQYGSLEAFTRAFHRAFGVSPSLYRRMGATHFRLHSPNAIHFCAPGSPPGDDAMDLFDIFAGGDTYHARKLLEYARQLSPEQLDAAKFHRPRSARHGLRRPSADSRYTPGPSSRRPLPRSRRSTHAPTSVDPSSVSATRESLAGVRGTTAP
jgi:AraC-like DNA-binding protein